MLPFASSLVCVHTAAFTSGPRWCVRKLLSNWSDAAIQLNLAPNRQEVKDWNINMTSGYFLKQNTPCWHQHKYLKKEKNTSSSANPSVGTLPAVVFMTHTYNCSREWSCVYRWNSSALRHQLSTVLRRGGLKTQPVGVAEQNRIGAMCSGHVSSGNLGLSSNVSCSWVGSRLDHFLTTNEPYHCLFETGPWPPLQQGLSPVVLVCTRVLLMCSHLPKLTAPRG